MKRALLTPLVRFGWPRPLFVLVLALVAFTRNAHAQSTAPGLESELQRISHSIDATVGFSALHVESGESVRINADRPFPMASTYKIAIAVQLLTLVDEGALRLDSLFPIEASDHHPGSGEISLLLPEPGLKLSVANLIQAMLLISDNTATDVALQAAGGPQAVTQRLRTLGIERMRVDRPTVLAIADFVGIDIGPVDEFDWDRYDRLRHAVTEDQAASAARAAMDDPRDTSTPDAMTDLLLTIWKGEALSEERTAFLLRVMTASSGPGRIRGRLPPGIGRPAHKTGTLIGGGLSVTNDVGIVTLPDERGHVIVVAFIKTSRAGVERNEETIADLTRTTLDYFLTKDVP